MGLSDSLLGRAAVMFSRCTRSLSLPPYRASQAPRPIFPRALSPTTPEGPASAFACCFLTGIFSGFILRGGLATFDLLTRPNRVHLRYGSRVCLPSHCWNPRSFGFDAEQAITW